MKSNNKKINIKQKFFNSAKRFLLQREHHLFVKGQYLYNIGSSRKIIEQLSCSHEATRDVYILRIENGIVLPRKYISIDGKLKSLGGVLNESYEYIAESEEYDFGGKYIVNKNEIRKCDEEVIYLGRGYPHYGVVMIDFIRRLYFKYTEEGKKLKLCFCGIHSKRGTFGDADERAWELLENMGIYKDDVIDVREPLKFKKVYIPEPGFEYEKYYHKEFLIPYKYIFDKVTANNKAKMLYLSRQKMSNKKEAGEDIIEKFFSINGYEVIYPDELSITEQVEWLKGAKIIASVEGTISHNILFCTPGTKQIVIRKHTRIEPRHFLFNELMKSPVVYIDCLFNFIPGFPRHYDIGPFCMLFNRNIREYAKDNGYKLPRGWFFANIATMFKYLYLCFLQKQKEIKNRT